MASVIVLGFVMSRSRRHHGTDGKGPESGLDATEGCHRSRVKPGENGAPGRETGRSPGTPRTRQGSGSRVPPAGRARTRTLTPNPWAHPGPPAGHLPGVRVGRTSRHPDTRSVTRTSDRCFGSSSGPAPISPSLTVPEPPPVCGPGPEPPRPRRFSVSGTRADLVTPVTKTAAAKAVRGNRDSPISTKAGRWTGRRTGRFPGGVAGRREPR